ncbi:putative disease resistance protein RGA3 [Ananas comosus]|uniref:Putative disease resistance protein RGA3 n=1 Tax=Ananas comosus TaxID=4615 RepID=A0A199V1R0_ANACO|nr:putative disease resistance protein RGA3 [Ananas comosus]
MGSLVDEPIVYGRDEEREKVIKLLGVPCGQSDIENDNESVSAPAKRRKKENVSVLSIYGIGGVGKTTLAQVVYNDERVVKHFDLKIWVCVSDNFDVNSLSKEIIDNAGKGYEADRMNLSSLQATLKEIVMAHRFLLVLDDVWNENSREWQKFYAPLSHGQVGSMILVTTRTLKVANIAGTMDPIFLEGLSGDVYWDFFKSCAFRCENPEDYPGLANIRCLKLSFCKITKLPESISNLKHLRYLDVSGTSIRTLPTSLCHLNNLQVLNVMKCPLECFPQGFTGLHNLRKLYPIETAVSKISEIGKLTSLQYLPQFEVRKDDQHKIGELKHMTQLHGCLHIKKLENVESKEDACEAELDNKPYLDELILEWSRGTSNSHHDIEVLEGLQPRQKLKQLEIRHYGGTTSPSWLRPQTLTCLSKLHIEECSKLTELPCLPPSLMSLVLVNVGLNSLPRLWDECQDSTNESKTQRGGDNSSNRSSSLRKLHIKRCFNLTSLEGWLMPHYLPSLEEFRVEKCKNLTLLPPDSFKDFVSLKSMAIDVCPKLTCRTVLILPPSIELVVLDDCGNLDQSLPRCLQNLKSLINLTIIRCPHVASLPEQVMCQLKSLEKLFIWRCEELSSLGGLGVLASLKYIRIRNCPKLADSEPPMFDFTDEIQRAEIGLRIDRTTLLKLQSLRNLVPFIRELEIWSPDEPEMFVGEDRELLLLFKSLKHLQFSFCKELNSLPTELHRLTSLQKLSIHYCSKIHFLPENGLPASLTKLDFHGCNKGVYATAGDV